MTDSKDLITDEVVSTAKRLEEMEDPEELDPLEVKATVDLRGNISEIIAVVTVGGPYIEVNLSNGTVYGAWGGDTHETHFSNDSLRESLEDRYWHQFEELVLQ